MGKKNPLVVINLTKERGILQKGLVFYVDDKKKKQFLSEADAIFKNLDIGALNEITAVDHLYYGRDVMLPLMNKYCQKFDDGRVDTSLKNFRLLSLEDPEYSTINETDGEVTILTNPRYMEESMRIRPRTHRKLTDREKELRLKAEHGNLERLKNNDGDLIFINYNTFNPFEKAFVLTKEHSDIRREMREKMARGEFPIQQLKKVNDLVKNKDAVKYDKELSTSLRDKLGKINRIRRMMTFDYHGASKILRKVDESSNGFEKLAKSYNKSVIENEDLKFPVDHIPFVESPKESTSKNIKGKNIPKHITRVLKLVYPTVICGNIRLNDYPNKKITPLHALDIDCDLLNTFNIHIGDLDSQSFQFIETDWSDHKMCKISLDGALKYEHVAPCGV